MKKQQIGALGGAPRARGETRFRQALSDLGAAQPIAWRALRARGRKGSKPKRLEAEKARSRKGSKSKRREAFAGQARANSPLEQFASARNWSGLWGG